MIDQRVAFVIDESKWLTVSMGSALLAVTVLVYRHRHSDLAGSRRVLAAMNRFFGVTIGAMAFGHLLAVKLGREFCAFVGSKPQRIGEDRLSCLCRCTPPNNRLNPTVLWERHPS